MNGLDYGNLNIMLAKQLSEAEFKILEMDKYIKELEEELANIKTDASYAGREGVVV